VRRFFAGRDPIGTRIHGWGSWFAWSAWQRLKYTTGRDHSAYFYVPFRQIYREDMNLAFYVRREAADSVLSTLRRGAQPTDPNVTVLTPRRSRSSSAHRSIRKKLLPALDRPRSIALLLAAVGLYSVNGLLGGAAHAGDWRAHGSGAQPAMCYACHQTRPVLLRWLIVAHSSPSPWRALSPAFRLPAAAWARAPGSWAWAENPLIFVARRSFYARLLRWRPGCLLAERRASIHEGTATE